MPYDPEKHHRRSIRLKGYDYSQPGAYVVTIVTHNRVCLFGEVVNGDMRLNRYGEIVQHAWFDLPRHYPYVRLGAFCVMPNHIHAIIIIVDDNHDDDGNDDVGAGLRPAPTWASPIDCGAIPGDDGAACVDDRASPTDVGAPPVDGGAAPGDDGAAPVDCGAIPGDDGAARVDDRASPTDVGAPPSMAVRRPVTTARRPRTAARRHPVIRYPKSCAPSNHFRRGASMTSARPLAFPSGNGIITTASSAMQWNTTVCVTTSRPIPLDGCMTVTTRKNGDNMP